MTLEDEITDAQSYLSDPPKNESNTCDWIILPLLRVSNLGYEKRDIESRVADNTNEFPDYTILRNYASATYYLEAKAWNIALIDIHVKQSLDYANHNGKRFVVLTNGQSWRLYDNAIQGLLGEKLITQAELRDTPQIADFLTSLSKSEVLSGSLERMAEEAGQRRLQITHELQQQQERELELQNIHRRQSEIRNLLDTTLPDMLSNAQSDLVGFIAIHLSEQEELTEISPEILSAWFSENLKQPVEYSAIPFTSASHAQIVDPFFSQRQGETTLTLKQLQGRPINGKKRNLTGLHLPGGTPFPVSIWVRLAIHIVRWLLAQPCPMPLPFPFGNRNRWFLNIAPLHRDTNLRGEFEEIRAQGKTVYMDKDRSAVDLLAAIYALCLEMKIDPDGIQITMLF